MDIELRTKTKDDFKKDFFMLINESVFGKTMEVLENKGTLTLQQQIKEQTFWYQNELIILQRFSQKISLLQKLENHKYSRINYTVNTKEEDIYLNIRKYVKIRFDTSNQELDRTLPKGKTKSTSINEKQITWKYRERICSIKSKNIQLLNR